MYKIYLNKKKIILLLSLLIFITSNSIVTACNIDNYISDAGGFNRIADIKRVYILLPNGQGFQSSELKKRGGVIPPGTIIIVPPKTDKLSLLGLTDVFSRVLGNIATSLLAINAVSK